MSQTAIPGYTYGTSAVPRSPLSLEDFERLKQTVLFSDEDSQSLRLSYDVLQDQVEAILDVWYGFVASHPFLVYFFSDQATGQPDGHYLAAVRKRFGQWILDRRSRELSLPARPCLPHHDHSQALPCQEGAQRRAGGQDAPGLAEVRAAPGHLVEPALYSGGGVLRAGLNRTRGGESIPAKLALRSRSLCSRVFPGRKEACQQFKERTI